MLLNPRTVGKREQNFCIWLSIEAVIEVKEGEPACEIEGRKNAGFVPCSPSFNIKPTFYLLHHFLFFRKLKLNLIYSQEAQEQINTLEINLIYSDVAAEQKIVKRVHTQ